MKKGLFSILSLVFMVSVLAACNTNEGAMDRGKYDYNQVNYGPQNQGKPGQYSDRQQGYIQRIIPGQNRFDANIPYEGLNPNGTTQTPNQFDQAEQYDKNGDQVNTNENRVDQVNGAFQEQVVQLTNKARKKQGLDPLKIDPEVAKVAQKKTDDMAKKNYFSHTSPTYGSPFQMLKQFGVDYRTAAENIAAGQQTPDQVVKGWLNSPGHRKNIMNKNLTHIGVGYSEDGSYWSQMFIGK
ncbi:CAP domain-containing protein [Halobacillus salinarum]|uniref:CAP domain-containing protein n=1 Tax=Halobacillus salinarum TaxID=2932257 RepID=A0ABY4EKW9_9BACI|nr:CAP domain-containing protein [Halobacillus salinarum]UOQ45111.1 CAP domain-containing protein [Halobacillus salinarum]